MEWIPRTKLGKMVAEGKITLDEIFKSGKKIKEFQIVDRLVPGLQSEIILIGGSPGKGGGIKRTPTRRTARMHRSGRRYKISAVAVVGDGNGHIGVGKAQALENRETVNKAIIAAKLNMIPIKRSCGSWECACGEQHSIPIKIEGKAGSVRVMLMPAPKGIGLCINDEAKKIIRLAGIKDIWSMSSGESKSRVNYAFAIYNAFKRMNNMKFPEDYSPEDLKRPVAREEMFETEELKEPEQMPEEETAIEEEQPKKRGRRKKGEE
jgi:small subunit ribosomal protein S5